jgi:hypothetical protein
MRAFSGLALAALVATGAVTQANPLPSRAASVADYRIAVTLDADAKQLVGQERIVWRNPSSDAVPDLWFHLYLNAFRNSRSTFFRESGGRLRGELMADDGWGWTDVLSMTLPDGTDLLKQLTFEAPDDGNHDDRTVARVTLPQPVAPGGSLTIDIRFKAQLPKVFARTGYARDYFLVGQWFPKLAVYEPTGLRGRATGGWNSHQFHATSEFYADFGEYHVDMTVPSAYIVGATGQRTGRRDNGNGTSTYTYEQANVHDFAWTASPRFVEVKRPFIASREVTAAEYEQTARRLGRTLDEVTLTDVDVTFLMQPEHMGQIERHARAARAAIKRFGLWYGRYPHRTLTIVDPPSDGGGSGGMEYPTFITAGTSALYDVWPFRRVREPELTVVHEFGHQYWQGMVASNEFEEAWLDEGMNSYSTGRVLEAEYGWDANVVSLLGLAVNEQDVIRFQNAPDVTYDTIRQPAWTYPSTYEYQFNSYTRPELTLRTLEHLLGPDVMARAMRTYSERWRFKHPSSDDFFAVLIEVSGRNLRPLLTQMFERGHRLDYAVAAATSDVVPGDAGWIDGKNGRTLVKRGDGTAQGGSGTAGGAAAGAAGGASAAGGAASGAAGGAPQYDTRVVVQRRGEIVLPVDVAFKFAGKPVERIRWDGESRQRVFTFVRPERLEWVNIDPERGYELDGFWLNNATSIDRDGRAATRLTSRVMFWIQQISSALGM